MDKSLPSWTENRTIIILVSVQCSSRTHLTLLREDGQLSRYWTAEPGNLWQKSRCGANGLHSSNTRDLLWHTLSLRWTSGHEWSLKSLSLWSACVGQKRGPGLSVGSLSPLSLGWRLTALALLHTRPRPQTPAKRRHHENVKIRQEKLKNCIVPSKIKDREFDYGFRRQKAQMQP